MAKLDVLAMFLASMPLTLCYSSACVSADGSTIELPDALNNPPTQTLHRFEGSDKVDKLLSHVPEPSEPLSKVQNQDTSDSP